MIVNSIELAVVIKAWDLEEKKSIGLIMNIGSIQVSVFGKVISLLIVFLYLFPSKLLWLEITMTKQNLLVKNSAIWTNYKAWKLR